MCIWLCLCDAAIYSAVHHTRRAEANSDYSKVGSLTVHYANVSLQQKINYFPSILQLDE